MPILGSTDVQMKASFSCHVTSRWLILASRLMRMMETAQTLQMKVRISPYERTLPAMAQLTHKKPRKNIPVSVHFCARLVCRVQTIGIGRHRIMISVRRLVIPLPTEK